jgi:hypothetical protein
MSPKIKSLLVLGLSLLSIPLFIIICHQTHNHRIEERFRQRLGMGSEPITPENTATALLQIFPVGTKRQEIFHRLRTEKILTNLSAQGTNEDYVAYLDIRTPLWPPSRQMMRVTIFFDSSNDTVKAIHAERYGQYP